MRNGSKFPGFSFCFPHILDGTLEKTATGNHQTSGAKSIKKSLLSSQRARKKTVKQNRKPVYIPVLIQAKTKGKTAPTPYISRLSRELGFQLHTAAVSLDMFLSLPPFQQQRCRMSMQAVLVSTLSHMPVLAWQFLKKLNINIPYNLAIPLLGICPREMKTCLH